jgi:plasmid stabilization system protein ParE
MVNRRARLSTSARSWLEREIEYLAGKNSSAAKRLVERIRDARSLLARHPEAARAGQIPGTRRFVVSPYALTLRDKDGLMEIVAIRHGRQADAYAPKELLDGSPSEASDDSSREI